MRQNAVTDILLIIVFSLSLYLFVKNFLLMPDTGNTGSSEADGIVSEGNNSNSVTPSPD